MRRLLPVALLFLTLGLNGCGSSGATASAPTTSTTAEVQPTVGTVASTQVVSGRAQSISPLVGATVQVYDMNGKSLLTTPGVTTTNGQFAVPSGMASAFRVVVTPAAGKLAIPPLACEVRDYQETWVGVNFVTNLVSVYMSEHPGITLAQAEERVHTFLQIPADVNLSTGLDSDVWFSRTLFAGKAAVNGGVEAYTLSLARQVDVGPPVTFAAEGAGESLLGGLSKDVAGNLISDALGNQLGNLFGWATSAAGFNIGQPSMKQISNQLNAIAAQLTALQAQINKLAVQGLYDSDQNQLEGDCVTPIGNASNDVQDLANRYSAVTTTPAPGPDAQTSNVITELAATRWLSLGNEILDYQLGVSVSNMVQLYGSIVMTSVNIASSPTVYQGYPVRMNGMINGGPSLWDQKMNQLTYYIQVVNQAVNLIAENAHVSSRDYKNNNGFYTSNATEMMDAKTSIATLTARSRQSLQQIPHALASDQVLIDMENGVTWYLVVQGTVQYPSVNHGTKIVTGPYGSINGSSNGGNRFDLPTQAQLDSLQSRLATISQNQGAAYKTPTDAMAALGFTLPSGTTELKVWMYSPNYNGNITHSGATDYNAFTYDLNNRKTDKHDTRDNPYYYYLVCIPFPGAAELSASNPLLANGQPGTITVTATSSTQMKATATNNPIKGGTQTVYRPTDDITGDVVWTSSDPTVAEISNFDGQQGQVIWHPNRVGGLTPVTFTAGFGTQSASLTVNPPSPLPVAKLTAIEVLPTNILYGVPPPSGTSDLYHATGIYSDQTAVSLDTQATWSVVQTSDGTPLVDPTHNQAGFYSTTPNLLVIFPTLQVPLITVQATYAGVTGKSPIDVSLILGP